jgi:hypothetical protein
MLMNRSIELTWSPPENTGGTEILYYFVYRRNETGSFEQIAKVPGSRTYYIDSNIFIDGLYVYYVIAENEIGRGPQSVKFDEEVPSSFFEGNDQDLGTPMILALVFLGLSFLIGIVAIIIFIRRRSDNDITGMEPMPVSAYTDQYPLEDQQAMYYPEDNGSYHDSYSQDMLEPPRLYEDQGLPVDLISEEALLEETQFPLDVPEE